MKYPSLAALFLAAGVLCVPCLLKVDQAGGFDSWNRAFLNLLISSTDPGHTATRLLVQTKLVPASSANRRNAADVTFLRVRPSDFEKGKLNPRLDWAVLLSSLLQFHPRLAGIVPPLRWDDSDVLTEGALAKQVKNMPPMALGAILSPSPPDAAQQKLSASFLSLERIQGNRGQLLEARQVAAMPDEELLMNGKPGFTHIEFQDELPWGRHGVRLPLICRLGDRVVPSFALQIAMLRDGLLPDDILVQLDGPQPRIQLGDRASIPVDSSGCLEVHPAIAHAFPKIDFSSLALAASGFQGVAQQLSEATKEELDGLGKNVIVIGFDDATLQECALPSGTKVSRAHLLAMQVAAMQSGFFTSSWPAALRFGSWGALSLLGLLALALPRWRSAAAGTLIAALYLLAAWIVFALNLSWTPPWPALMLCLLQISLGAVIPRKSRRRRWFPSKIGA